MYTSMNQSPSHNLGTPADNWASGHKPRKDSTLWVPAMLIGALIFAVGCGSGLVVGWMSGSMSGFGSLLEDFDLDAAVTVQASYPDSVVLGDSFELIITITDTSGNSRTIEDVDFSGSLIGNAEFVSVSPHPRSTSTSTDPSYIEHVFGQPLAANRSADITFDIKPTKLGVYTTDISVYMNGYNSQYTTVTIDVVSP